MSRRKAKGLAGSLARWFADNARELPWRQTTDPYAIFVSEVMLQQTQVSTVIPFWTRWMAELPDLGALAACSEPRLLKLWEGLGYYSRARNLQKAAQLIQHHHNGRFPRDFPSVLALPGVGRYTAGAICSIAFGQPTPVLDGNVMRVLTRLFAIPGDPRNGRANQHLWALSDELVRAASTLPAWGNPTGALNQALMELGATICTPRRPQCRACPIRRACQARLTSQVRRFPETGTRPATIPRRVAAFVAKRNGRFLLTRQEQGRVNRGLWEFPSMTLTGKMTPGAACAQLGLTQTGAQPIFTIRHSITRYRIALEVFPASQSGRGSARGRWLTVEEMDCLALSSAHRKIADRLLIIHAPPCARQARGLSSDTLEIPQRL